MIPSKSLEGCLALQFFCCTNCLNGSLDGKFGRRGSAHRKIKMRVAERLVFEREVPPFLFVWIEAVAAHRVSEQLAVGLRLRAHAAIGRPRLRAEEIERRAHIEFLA